MQTAHANGPMMNQQQSSLPPNQQNYSFQTQQQSQQQTLQQTPHQKPILPPMPTPLQPQNQQSYMPTQQQPQYLPLGPSAPNSSNIMTNGVATNNTTAPRGYVPKKVIENYSYCLHDELGQGYSSKVYRGRDERTGETVAIKVIDMKMVKNEVQVFLLKNEINVMRKINNINCLKLLDVFQTSNNTYIITEFCNQGDLKDLLTKYGRLPEKQAVKILVHIINGFRDLTSKHVIHRDIQPANILLHDGLPKIADFGFAQDLDSPPCRVYYNVGSPIYMSLQSLVNNEYSYQSDIWSIGIMYYELLFGVTPWTANNQKELTDKISQLPVQFPPHVDVSDDSKDFIFRCLQVDEPRRIAPSELENHTLIKKASIEYMQEKRQIFEEQHQNTNPHAINLPPQSSNDMCEAPLHSNQQGTSGLNSHVPQQQQTNSSLYNNNSNVMVNEGPSLNDNKQFFQVNTQQTQQSLQNYNNVQQQQQQQSGHNNRNYLQSAYGQTGYPPQNEFGVFQRGLASPQRGNDNEKMMEEKENNGPAMILNNNNNNQFQNVLGVKNGGNSVLTPTVNMDKIMFKANQTQNGEQPTNQFSVEFGGSFATNSFTNNNMNSSTLPNNIGHVNTKTSSNALGQQPQRNLQSTNNSTQNTSLNGGNSNNISHSNVSTASTSIPTKSVTIGTGSSNDPMVILDFSKEVAQDNDQVILAQINFCRFLFRLGKLIDDNSIFETPLLQERLQFFIMQNIMVKITKLKEMVDNGTNPLLLKEWSPYSASDSYQQFSSVINEYYVKYSNYFKFHWDNVFSQYRIQQELASDKKFDAVFDLNYIEFESFYIILQSFLRYSIRQMNTLIQNQVFEEGEWMPSSVEGAIVLLDYLVTYFQLSSLILDYFGNNGLFAKASKIEQIADGNPVQLTQSHYNQIRNKIQSLEI